MIGKAIMVNFVLIDVPYLVGSLVGDNVVNVVNFSMRPALVLPQTAVTCPLQNSRLPRPLDDRVYQAPVAAFCHQLQTEIARVYKAIAES